MKIDRYFDGAWMKRNILGGHGPLCAIYEAHPQKGFRSEGDSPAFMHQIEVGLRSLEHPGYGSWGGRFTREEPGSAVWKGIRDGDDLGKPIPRPNRRTWVLGLTARDRITTILLGSRSGHMYSLH